MKIRAYLLIALILLLIPRLILGQDEPGRVKQNILKAVVQILGPQDKNGDRSTGTGFFISKEYEKEGQKIRRVFLVTNKHMVGDWNISDGDILNYADKISVYFYTTSRVEGNLYELIDIDLKNKVNDKILLHPNPKVDIAIIKFDEDVINKTNIDFLSFDASFLISFDKIISTFTGMGDQIFAIGYPLGITSIKNHYPIAKSGYFSSFPGSEMIVKMNLKNRKNENKSVDVDGKLLLIDGLIVGGNSGSPVVLPSEVKTRINSKTKQLEHTEKETENSIVGIVSSGWSMAGLTVAYSSDYIIELIDKLIK